MAPEWVWMGYRLTATQADRWGANELQEHLQREARARGRELITPMVIRLTEEYVLGRRTGTWVVEARVTPR